jgi:apolipoprotein N-acyltransferase
VAGATVKKNPSSASSSSPPAPASSPGPGPGAASWLDLPAVAGQRATLAAAVAATLTGVMWFLASADFDIWPLAYVAMVPLLWVIDKTRGARRVLFWGWIAGVVTNLGGFYWISALMTRHAGLPLALGVLATVLLCAYQAVVFLLFAGVLHKIRAVSAERLGRPLPMVLLAPLVMVAFELLVPFIFPWYLAIAQAWVPVMIQIAELTGPAGVTAVLLVINGALYDVISESTGKRRIGCAAGAAVCVAAVLGFGAWRLQKVAEQRAAAAKVRVGVVQSNIALDPHLARPAGEIVRDLQDVSGQLEGEGAQLLMWPESSFPYWIPRALDRDPGGVRRGFTVPVVFGAITFNPGVERGDGYPYNSALLLDSDGAFRGRYDKIYRLIFGEYIPGLETFPFIRELLPSAASHFAGGEDVTTFPLVVDGQRYRLGPMICYEDILPGFGRELGAQHPHLLVNITNDTWFGDTAEPWQHLALAVFRTVELRTDLIRAVNTGVSAFVDAGGRVRKTTYVIDPAVTPMGVDGVVVEAALLEGGHTFYARFGELFAYLCVLAVAFLWLVWPRLRRARRS